MKDIHTALRDVLDMYGLELIRNNLLTNYLADLNCFSELHSAKNILREILSIYGESIYEMKVDNSSYQTILLKYKNDFAKSHGYQLELVDYLFDCISYGLEWDNNANTTLNRLRQTHLNTFKEKKKESPFAFYANLYHHFGINITHIKGNVPDKRYYLEYHESLRSEKTRRTFKHPTDSDWKRFFTEEQDIEYINSLDWDDATGIGMVTGFNQIRALDFDYLQMLRDSVYGGQTLDDYIHKILSILKLPNDYQWVTRSGSGSGIHVIFKCKDIDDFDCNTVSFEPSMNIKKKGEGFERLELRWKAHLVLPPSISIGFYDDTFMIPACERYWFHSGNFPCYSPMEVVVDDLNNLLNYFSSVVMKVAYVGAAPIIGHYKITSEIDSYSGGNIRFEATEKWAKACSSNDNEEYVTYLLSDTYKKPERIIKAVEILRKSNTAISHYNLASLIASKKTQGTKTEAMTHFSIAQKAREIDKDEIDMLRNDIERM